MYNYNNASNDVSCLQVFINVVRELRALNFEYRLNTNINNIKYED